MTRETRAHVICGPPAAGKTRYARELASQLGGCLLDSDQVGEKLVRAGLALAGLDPDDRDSPAYKAAFRQAVYETLFDLARANLDMVPVVIAGPFTSECGDPEWPARLELTLGTPVTVHFIWCSPALRRQRIESRGEDRDKPKLAAWESYLATCREEPPVFPHVWVDTGR